MRKILPNLHFFRHRFSDIPPSRASCSSTDDGASLKAKNRLLRSVAAVANGVRRSRLVQRVKELFGFHRRDSFNRYSFKKKDHDANFSTGHWHCPSWTPFFTAPWRRSDNRKYLEANFGEGYYAKYRAD